MVEGQAGIWHTGNRFAEAASSQLLTKSIL